MNKLYAEDRLVAVIPDEDDEPKVIGGRKTTGHNCRNCGAPLDKNGDCVYCGTVRQHSSGVVMTSNSIMFYCE